MKILFLSYYYYIQYIPFKQVIKELLNEGVDAKLLYISNISPKDERKFYNPQRFRQDDIPFIEFKLYRFALENKFFRPLLQIMQFFRNRWRLKNLLKKLQPDGIVIGSHLGGIYIRLIQILCDEMKIPITSMWLTEDKIVQEISIPILLPLPWLLRDILKWKSYNKHTQKHLFIVTGDTLKKHLMKMGVEKEQIIITGNPSHDEIYECIGKPKHILEDLDLKEREKYIVLLTEVIHEIFGIDYLKRLVKVLKSAFCRLPPYIKVVIKFHPRETKKTKNIFRDALQGSRYCYFENADLVCLLSGAEISIGHFTKALETSFVVGTPVLSINFLRNEEYSLYKGGNKILECLSPQEFEEKLISFFMDKSFYQKAKLIEKKWLEDNIYTIDGKSTYRVVDAILAHVNNFGGIK